MLKADGLQVGGKYHKLGLTIPFDTTAEFQTTGTAVFEVRIREVDLDGIDVEFLNGFILDSLKKRLDQSLKNICTFRENGSNSDHNRALEVTVDSKALIPALQGFHLVDVDISDREFLLKIGS